MQKVGKLINAFKIAEVSPFVQLGASKPEGDYGEIVRQLRRMGEDTGVKYSVHQSIWLPDADFYINIASSNEQIRRTSIESLKESIGFARDIGASHLSFHAGYATDMLTQAKEFDPLDNQNNVPYDTAYRNSITGMFELLDFARPTIRLSIENFNYRPEKRYMFSLPEDFDKLPDEMGVILNSGHVYYSSKRLNSADYVTRIIEKVKDRVLEMHVNDNDGTEDQHKLVGDGDVPLRGMIQGVSRDRKLPGLIIEAHQARHHYSDQDLVKNISYLASLEETIRKSL